MSQHAGSAPGRKKRSGPAGGRVRGRAAGRGEPGAGAVRALAVMCMWWGGPLSGSWAAAIVPSSALRDPHAPCRGLPAILGRVQKKYLSKMHHLTNNEILRC